jgi:hypothetical protein
LNRIPPVPPLFRPIQFFGTLGFFHNLIDPSEAEDWTQGRSTGQWNLRMPYHALEPERLVDEKLAQDWLNKANEIGIQPALTPEEVINRNLNRGDLLEILFELLPTDITD